MATLKTYNEYLKKRIVHENGYYYIEGYSGKYTSRKEAKGVYEAMGKLTF